MRKLLFFDLDGTLWDFDENITKGVTDALKRARRAGHLVFANTGRSRAAVHQDVLFNLPMDGLVTGGGTLIELPGEGRDHVVEERAGNMAYAQPLLSWELLSWTIREGRQAGVRFLLEGPDYLYMGREDASNHWFFASILKRCGAVIRDIHACDGAWEASKMTCDVIPGPRTEALLRQYEQHYQIVRHSDTTIELTPHGMDKGRGIREVCRILHADIGDSIAFGDSANDLMMLRAAGTAVVMGNGADAAKAEADLICPDIHEDGVARALETLKLI